MQVTFSVQGTPYLLQTPPSPHLVLLKTSLNASVPPVTVSDDLWLLGLKGFQVLTPVAQVHPIASLAFVGTLLASNAHPS